MSLRGWLVAGRRHDASARTDTSHYTPAVSGTVMNSCPCPHQLTTYWSRPKGSQPARRRSATVRVERVPEIEQDVDGHLGRLAGRGEAAERLERLCEECRRL